MDWPRRKSRRERMDCSMAATRSFTRSCYGLWPERQARFTRPPDNGRILTLPRLDWHRGVNRAEIECIVPVSVKQVFGRQAWIHAQQAGFLFGSDAKPWRCGAVIAPSAGILGRAPPEFAEGHEQHPLEVPRGLEVVNERFCRVAQVLQQARLRPGLIGVRVIASL